MKNISQLKEERENKQSLLFKKLGVFFAFSNKQFDFFSKRRHQGDCLIHLTILF
jgi:hypothetical protein